MPQFPDVISVMSLNGVNGFRLDGAAAYDLSGFSVAAAGDVNGDGFADLVVGAYRASPNGDYSGAAYVLFGGAGAHGAVVELSALNGANGFMIAGGGKDDRLGLSVSSAGDVNRDGIDDIIVGAPGGDAGGLFSNTGSSYVVYGRSAGFGAVVQASSLNGANGFRLIGGTSDNELNDESGRSVSAAGDINGDGIDDLIVGAYRADPNGNLSGSSYVVFGKKGGLAATVNLATLKGSDGFRIDGEANPNSATGGYSAGFAVASAGDVNGDGFGDILIGAYRASHTGLYGGSSYVIFGKSGGFTPTLQLASLNGKNGFRMDGAELKERSGFSLAAAGDINGDGFGDVVIGAKYASSNGAKSGASYVVFGKGGAFAATLDLGTLNGVNGFRIDGAEAQDASGFSVASAGDVNGDGFGDLIIGTYFVGLSGESSGASYVVFGKASGFGAHINLATMNGANGFRIAANSDADRAGHSVAAAGDLNGDGFGDLIVGAPGAAPHGEESGSTYVIYGYEPTTAVTRIGTNISQTIAGGKLNDALSGLGGDDKLYGRDGADTMSGGTGRDKMDGSSGNDSMSGGAGRDSMSSGSGDDSVSGDEDNDDLGGGSGNDLLSGGTGADRMFGADGNDNFNSGSGKDSMVGGDGADRFFFTSASWGGDYISDFQDSLDILRFKTLVADSVKDFAVKGDGTTDVTISIGDQTLQLHGAKAIFLTDADFQFFA